MPPTDEGCSWSVGILTAPRAEEPGNVSLPALFARSIRSLPGLWQGPP